MRLFIGIPLASSVSRELSTLSMGLRAQGDGLRWSAPESWHITLQFLGNASQQQYACIIEHLRVLRSQQISIQLESLGFFERAGILYVNVRSSVPLNTFQQAVAAATARCGFPADPRPFHPHVTLARRKGKEGKRDLHRLKAELRVSPHFTNFIAENFLLYESFTGPSGSRYEIRERFPINNIEAA